MNCSVIEMGRVSLLLNEGTTVTASVLEQEVQNQVHYAKKKERELLEHLIKNLMIFVV